MTVVIHWLCVAQGYRSLSLTEKCFYFVLHYVIHSYLCFDLTFAILKFFIFRDVPMWEDKGIGFCLGKWNNFSN